MAEGGHSASGLFISGSADGGAAGVSTAGLGGYEGTRTDVGRRYGLGTIRWVGESAALGPGVWAGVELDQKLGKHDGTVFGMPYFVCAPGHGLMTRVEKLSPAKSFEEGDRKVIAAARSRNATLRQRSASRQGGRPASRQDALTGNFAERAFTAARDSSRATLGLAMGDAAKDAAQSAVRAAKLRARAMAEKERTSDHRAWHFRGATESMVAEDRAAAASRTDLLPSEAGSFDDRSTESQRSSQRSAAASADSERRIPVTSVPTDDELAVLASALGAPKQSAPSADTWPWAVGPVEEPAQEPAGTTALEVPDPADTITREDPEDSPGVDPAVESAAAAALDVDPQHLRAVFEAARAASAGSAAGIESSVEATRHPPPSQSASLLTPQKQPHSRQQQEVDEDDMGDSNLGRWEQDDDFTSGGVVFANSSPGIEMTSKMRRSRESFGAELTNSNVAQLNG